MLSRFSMPVRPVDWPLPGSRAAVALGWLHFLASILGAGSLHVVGVFCYVVGGHALVCLVALAAPVAAVLALGWLSRRTAHRVLPPSC